MPCLFLSHSSHDTDAARELKRRLLASPEAKDARLEIWLDVDDLREGLPWLQQLEQAIARSAVFAVVVGSTGVRNWVRAETDLALDRAVKDERFRVVPILHGATSIDSLSPFARRFQGVRDPLNDAAAMQRLLAAVLGQDGAGFPALTDAPFPGLHSMTEEWADRFFGRRDETEEVLALLRRHRVVTMVADSGAGKSSLAQAGVAHAWRGGALLEDRPRGDVRDAWHVVTMRPSQNPLERLRDAAETAAGQLGRSEEDRSVYRKALETDPTFALRCGLDPAECRTLLIIDQAEELITLAGERRRKAFGELVAGLVESMGDRLRVLVTVRSDHWNLLSQVPGLDSLVREKEAQFRLKQPADLAEIVRGPLALAGHRNTDEQSTLIVRLRTDLSDRPGDLALAQMALSLAWRDRNQHGGLLGAYAAGGGALTALGREAERVEKLLPDEQARTLMPIFIRLIRLSDTGISATRRIAGRDEFNAVQLSLIDDLASEDFGRLLQTSEKQVEIAHEALIIQWPSLHQFLQDNAGELRKLDDLMRRARGWLEAERNATHLTSLSDEERFQRLGSEQGAWLAPLECEYLTWTEAGHARVREEREVLAREKTKALQEREQALARNKRVVWRGVAVASVLLILLSAVGWYAYQQSVEAAQSRADALALFARSEARSDPITAIMLALAAWPESPKGPFPARSVVDAINTAIARTAPHRVLTGHDGSILDTDISMNGHRLLSGGADGTLRLWDADSGEALGNPMRGHEGPVRSVAFSPDGRRLLSGGMDGTLRLWDAGSGEQLDDDPMPGHKGAVTSVAFSLDGHLLSGGVDGTLRLWDAKHREPLGDPMPGHRGSVESVAFSPKGRRFLSGGDDGTLRLWDVASREALGGPMVGHEGSVQSVAFSPNGRRLLSGGDDGTLRLWDMASREGLGGPMLGHEGAVQSVAFSPNGRRLLSGGIDGTLRLWDADNGEALGEPIRTHENGVRSVAFSPNGYRLLSGGDGRLRFWDANSGKALGEPMRGHLGRQLVREGLDEFSPSWRWWPIPFVVDVAQLNEDVLNETILWYEVAVQSVAFSPDGLRLLSGGDDGSLRLWDADRREELDDQMRRHEGSVRSVAFSTNGRWLLSGGDDGTLRLWNAAGSEPPNDPMLGHKGSVQSVAFSPNGRRLLSGGDDGTLRLWDAASRETLGGPMLGHEGSVQSVAFSPNGRRLLSGGDDGTLRLWDAGSREALGGPMLGHEGSVQSVAFSPNGRRLLSGGDDGTLRLWDTASREALGGPMLGHEGSVQSVAFSPNGRRLLSGGDDGTLRLWDVASRDALGDPMRGHEGLVQSVAFSPGGDRLLSGGSDGTLRLWKSLPAGNLLQVACRYLPNVRGRPTITSEDFAKEIGVLDLGLPPDCDSYDPPVPVGWQLKRTH